MPKHCLLCCLLFASVPLIGQSRARPQRLDSPPTANTIVRQVIFANAALLSAQDRKQLTGQIRQDGTAVRLDQSPGDPLGVADVAEGRVLAACVNEGYAKALVSAVAKPVADDSANRQFDIVIKIDYGQRYSLREVHFINAKAFSEAELLKTMPIQPGEIFNRAKISEGLQRLQQLYDTAGYLNFTSIPHTQFDEASAAISLTIDVDEGKLFHWGELHITGLDAGKTQALTDGWDAVRGKPYSPNALRDFCAKFFHPLPRDTDPAEYTKREINERLGTVDISIAFASPPWIPD
jgi:outer membrane translocation and assembly module TamA